MSGLACQRGRVNSGILDNADVVVPETDSVEGGGFKSEGVRVSDFGSLWEELEKKVRQKYVIEGANLVIGLVL